MNQENITLLYQLLGRAVLLPVPVGEKGCKLTGWPQTSWEQTQTQKYRKSLLAHGNIGVLLGEASGHLITVDCDTDAGLGEFLALNPRLRATLITKGARGGNVWLRMTGDYPPRTLKLGAGGKWGEFRSGGSMTIIAGTHPDGHNYLFIREASPIALDSVSIHWPEEASPARKTSLRRKGGGGSSVSLQSACLHTACLHNTPAPDAHCTAARIRATLEFERDNPSLNRIMQGLCSPFLPLVEGSRNTILTHELAPRLFSALARQPSAVVLEFLVASGQLGGYDRQETCAKFFHTFDALVEAYPDTLSAEEQVIFDKLDDRHRDLFRIARALALNEDPKYPPPKFYLSAGALAARLGIPDMMQAWRSLRRFRQWGILRQLDKGLARAPGTSGRAAEFAWALPISNQQPRL
jgi:hypothetical protein